MVAMHEARYGEKETPLVKVFQSVYEAAKHVEGGVKQIYTAISTGKNYRLRHFKWHDDILEGEVWGLHDNGYRVSTFGRVQGKSRGKTYGSNRKAGYKVIYDGSKMMMVHRLVLQTFNPTEDETLMVDHIDGVKSNNKLENLRWVTAKENAANRKPREKFAHCSTCECFKNE